MRAEDGSIDESNIYLVRPAARFDSDLFASADDLEEIWNRLQNAFKSWTDDEYAQCLTDFPRSMSVGDLVVLDNGNGYRCVSIGFEPFDVKELKLDR